MIKLNNHYFISWLNTVKQKRIHIRKEGIFVDIISSEYLSLLEEYSNLPLNDTDYKGVTPKITKTYIYENGKLKNTRIE